MRAALYIRVSTDEQAKSDYSLEDQLDKLEAYCDQQGWEVVPVVEDDGRSGTDPTRPGLLELFNLARSGRIDVALAAKRDRFFRDRFLRLAMDQDIEEHGVRLVASDTMVAQDRRMRP